MTPTREEWRPVPGYEGYYEVSNQGRVRSLDRLDAAQRRRQGKLMAPALADAGRLTIRLSNKPKRETVRVSVLVLTAFVGPRPEGAVGCHNDGDPANNRLSNLRWDSQSANLLDAVRHGTHSEARKTHCSRGHLLTAPNLQPALARAGKRICLACTRATHARRKACLRGEPFDFQQVADEKFGSIMRAA